MEGNPTAVTRADDGLRERLGRVGVWSGAPSRIEAAAVRELVAEVEELGYGAIWYPEAVWKESFAVGASLLAWTSRIVVGSGITNIWARDPTSAASGAKTLAETYPGRFVMTLGISHRPVVELRGHEYGRPVETMRAYLDGIDAAPYMAPEPEQPAPRLLAALAPRMLELAAERAAGSHTYFVPVEHTADARERLGPAALLVVEQAVILDGDAEAVRKAGREYLDFYLAADNYRRNLFRLGFTEEDLAESERDRLLDTFVAHGEDSIRERVLAHLEAGADHVCIQPLPGPDPQLDQLRRLAPVLL